MSNKIRPLGDKIFVKRLPLEEKTAGGIIIPDVAKEKAQTGEVLAVGPGRLLDDGTRSPLDVQVGDHVFFGKYAGTEAGPDLLIIREEEILGVIEK